MSIPVPIVAVPLLQRSLRAGSAAPAAIALSQTPSAPECTMKSGRQRPRAVTLNEICRKLIGGYILEEKLRAGSSSLAQVNRICGGMETPEVISQRVPFDRFICDSGLAASP